MARLARVIQKLFGSTAGANQVSKFGSYAAGLPEISTDPTTIQALPQWLTGWFGAAVGGNSPTIQDMNAVHLVYAYQLAYLMQLGIPEYQAATTYYIGSLVNDGAGNIYKSFTDNNTGNALSNAAKWVLFRSTGTVITPVASPRLSIIRGAFRGTDGVVLQGEGFTVSRTGAGAYTINLTVAFNSSVNVPVIVCTPARVGTPFFLSQAFMSDETQALITTYNVTGAVAADCNVDFIIIGQPAYNT